MRAKYVTFAAILLMMGYVAVNNERFLIDASHPDWDHFRVHGAWFYVHIVAGIAALLLAPLQFSDRLRRRYTGLHRVVGRIYVGGVLILAPIGAYLQYLDEAIGLPRTFTMAATVDAALLVITTAIALLFAVRRRITQHRQWMTRSYAVALVFFEVRVILGLTGWGALGPAVVEAVIWGCLAFSLLLAEVANNWHELTAALAPRRLPAPSREAARTSDAAT